MGEGDLPVAENDEAAWLEGVISVTAVLESASRELYAVYVRASHKRKHERPLARLLAAAVAQNIPVEWVNDDFIAAHVRGGSHGGVVARVGPRRLLTLAELVTVKERRPFIAMLDGVEDPFNFAQAVRALYAAGANGLVVRPRNWLSAAGTVARASAGATEWMPTAVAESAEEAAAFFRTQGLTIACTGQEKAISIYGADLTRPLFVLIGGEKRGITRSFMRQADLCLEIPYGRDTFTQSLGTAAATAVLSFELMRQRLR